MTITLDRPGTKEAELMRSVYPMSVGWEHINEWLEWASEHGFLGQIWNGDSLVGVGVARPVRDVLLASSDYYYFDMGGPTVWLDIGCCPVAGGMANLWYMTILRFGVREGVAFRRNGGRVRMYDFKRFTKAVAGGV